MIAALPDACSPPTTGAHKVMGEAAGTRTWGERGYIEARRTNGRAESQLDFFAPSNVQHRSTAPKGEPKTMPVKHALHRYGIGRTKLYELLGSGALKASKLGAKTLIDVEVADAFFGALPDFRERERTPEGRSPT